MKTLLIIICVIIGIMFLGLLAPAVAAAMLAWLFFACDFNVLGVLMVLAGIIGEIAWIYSFYADFTGASGSGGSYDYNDDVEPEEGGNQFSWPMMFGITFLVDKMNNKDKSK